MPKPAKPRPRPLPPLHVGDRIDINSGRWGLGWRVIGVGPVLVVVRSSHDDYTRSIFRADLADLAAQKLARRQRKFEAALLARQLKADRATQRAARISRARANRDA